MKNKHTICVSGGTDISYLGLDVIDDVRNFGGYLSSKHITVFAAASPGFCFWVGKGVSEKQGSIVGFSPAATKKEHKELYRLPEEPFSSIVYTGLGFPGRNLTMMRSADALIVGPGQIETFHEFMSALEENKVIGVWEGPWDIDEAIHEVVEKKAKKLNVIFDKDPKKLVERIIKILDTNKQK